ncbi:VOC family protein [Pseudorhodoferax sp.]|uniref:VOC family protein n=1 Tax=Pseudorhodoferax sp. TaxID=1993553 RepID=UPI002DD63EFE|nr:VOC family protein [Pseudorhodoferax sp.]
MNTRPKPSCVVFAKDVAALAHFYREVVDMAVVHADADHTVLDQEGFQLVVHGIPPAIAAQIEITRPPYVREDTPIKLCLPVARIADARSKAAQLGGQVQPPSAEWQARGFRACDGHDPEGNVFQVRESLG